VPRLRILEDRTVPSTFTVTNLGDSGDGSLRQAILDANSPAYPGADVINFAPGLHGTIALSGDPLSITDDLTIEGLGADAITVSGTLTSQVFEIAGVTASISGLTIADGFGYIGGGIYNTGTLTLSNTTLSGNYANYFWGYDGFGGGIYNAGTLTVSNSTLSGNEAGVHTSNSGGVGGGIYNAGTLTLSNSTLSDNYASGGCGGIYNEDGGTATVGNTIVAGNSSPAVPDVSGAFSSLGYNLIGVGDGATGFTGAGDQVGTIGSPIDPLLGPLADNGGPTWTHALLPGSPAIDAGDPAATGDFDQRGLARIVDGNGDGTATIDIGAYEVQPAPPGNTPPVAQPQSVTAAENTARAITLTASDADGDPLTYTVVSGPSHGTLSGSGANRTYTPFTRYEGADSFTVKANDGQADSNVAAVSITVIDVTAPAAQGQSVSTPVNTARPITLTATDADGDSLSYAVVSGPAHGTLSGSGASRTYTPFVNYVGPDSFTFKANDGSLDSNVATVSITVTQGQSGNVIVNPGFETGNFSGWTVVPDPYGTYFGVGGRPHSGRYAAYFGSYWGRDDIYQNVPTTPGHTYRISYWVANDGSAYGSGWTEIRSSWGGAVLEDLFPDRAFPYQQHTFNVAATSTSTQFRIGGYGYLYFWHLDDVSVTDTTPAGAVGVALGTGIASGNSVADAVFAAAVPGSLTAHGLGGFASSGGLAPASAGQGVPARGVLSGVNVTALDQVFASRKIKRAVFSPGEHQPALDLGAEFSLRELPA
jgi:hypothetical protein